MLTRFLMKAASQKSAFYYDLGKLSLIREATNITMGFCLLVASHRMTKPVLFLTALGLSLSSVSLLAGPLSEGAVPLPYVKPDNPAPAAFPMPLTTGTIPRTGRLAPAPVLKAGLDALSDNDAKRALAVRNSLPTGSVDRQALTWALAFSGLPGVSSQEI